MEKSPVNPVDKIELPKTEQPLEHFPLSEQEKNIQEVFKLSPELESIAVEATKSGETISLYRIENKNIEKEPDGVTSHKDLKGQWFSPDLETALVYLRKSQQTFGTEAKRVEGANLVVVKVPKEEFENLHVSKHPIASQMDVENDNYIIPENIERNYINLDDVQDKVGNFENLQKAKEQIKEKVKQFETKEAVELYCEYLKTIFPESKVQDIVWHYSDNEFKDENFKPTKPNFDTLNSIEGVYNFSTSQNFVKRYGKNAYAVILNINNPIEVNTSGEYVDDMDRPLSEALFKIGKQKEKNILAPKFDEKLENTDAVINNISGEEYIEKHPVSGREFGLPKQKIISVFHPDQISILGSKTDIEKFKEFVSKKENRRK
ncbi:MAG: hypothetical protein U0469_02375 [Candidatus Paceibacterota bacterium]